MKKLLSVILASSMILTAVPAYAQEETEDYDVSSVLAGAMSGDEEAGLSSLLGLLGGLKDNVENVDLSSVLDMLGGLKDADLSAVSDLLGGLKDADLSAVSDLLKGAAGESGDFDPSALLELLGGAGDETEADQSGLSDSLGDEAMTESESSDVSDADIEALLGLLGADTQDETPEDVIKADSIEQFYGTWTIEKASIFGEEVPPEEVLDNGSSMSIVINEAGVFDSEDDSQEGSSGIKLEDGVLLVGDGSVAQFYLTESGIRASMGGMLTVDYVPAD